MNLHIFNQDFYREAKLVKHFNKPWAEADFLSVLNVLPSKCLKCILRWAWTADFTETRVILIIKALKTWKNQKMKLTSSVIK